MSSKAYYEIVYVLKDGTTRIIERYGAPNSQQLWRLRPQPAIFVTRYMPSRKQWVIYDLRFFKPGLLRNGRPFVKCAPALHYTADRDAAVMFTVLAL